MRIRIPATFSAVLVLGTACVVSESNLGDPMSQDDDESSSTGGGGSTSSTTVADPPRYDVGNGARLDVHPSDTADPTNDDSGTLDEGTRLDVAVGLTECQMIDHESCWDAVIFECDGPTELEIDAGCVAAVEACYPRVDTLLAAADLIAHCYEPVPVCIGGNEPCSEQFCECTSGAPPYDWTDCWRLLLAGCRYGAVSDCQALVDSCYPGVTAVEYDACQDQVIADDEDCGAVFLGALPEHCESSLAQCLGA